MLHLRQQAWDGLCMAGKVPTFLQRWHSYAMSLSVCSHMHIFSATNAYCLPQLPAGSLTTSNINNARVKSAAMVRSCKDSASVTSAERQTCAQPSELPDFAFLRRILRSASGDLPTPLNSCPAALFSGRVARKRQAPLGIAGTMHAFARAKRQKLASPTPAADTGHLLCTEE